MITAEYTTKWKEEAKRRSLSAKSGKIWKSFSSKLMPGVPSPLGPSSMRGCTVPKSPLPQQPPRLSANPVLRLWCRKQAVAKSQKESGDAGNNPCGLRKYLTFLLCSTPRAQQRDPSAAGAQTWLNAHSRFSKVI